MSAFAKQGGITTPDLPVTVSHPDPDDHSKVDVELTVAKVVPPKAKDKQGTSGDTVAG